jgi:hypothetical protein
MLCSRNRKQNVRRLPLAGSRSGSDHQLDCNGRAVECCGLVTRGDPVGIRTFHDSLKRKALLVRGVVLHSGKARPSGGHRQHIFLGLTVEGLLASRTAEVNIASLER